MPVIPNDEESGPSTVTDYEPTADSAEVEDSTTSEAATTEHTRRKKMAEKWKELRCSARRVMVEGFAWPEAICCCCFTTANVRCFFQCGACVYYCSECGVSAHQNGLYRHIPEVWKVRLFIIITCIGCLISRVCFFFFRRIALSH